MSQAGWAGWPPRPLHHPDPPLSDGTVTLTAMTGGDLEAVTVACNDPEIVRWLPLPVPYSELDAVEFLHAQRREAERGTLLNCAVRSAGQATMAGSIGASFTRGADGQVELGYWIAPQARGRGLASAAVRLLAAHVFATYHPYRIEILAQPANVASRKVAERAGASLEGVRRHGVEHRGERRDACVYSLLPRDVVT